MFERIVQASACARSLAWSAALGLGLAGCPHQELAPLGPCTVSATAQRVEQEGLSKVDLLFVMDASPTMATEQVKIAEQIPRLVQVLTTGDRDLGRTPPAGGPRTFPAVSSLHLGLISVNLGGLEEEILPESITSVGACAAKGDDGLFLNSVEVAVNGVTAPDNTLEFPDYQAGEVVLAPDDACAEIPQPPTFQKFEAGKEPSAEDVATALSCISKLGVTGCMYEQQLEAMWKALAPSDGEADFLGGTSGHGDPDGENAGFLRDDAILAVIIVSDEDDCSINEEGRALQSQSAEANQRFGLELNLRCGLHGERNGFLRPVSRYVEGLRSLKPDNPDRVIFGAIVGVPARAAGRPYAEVLAYPEMQFRPAFLGEPQPSCTGMTGNKREAAYPARRFVQVAQGIPDSFVHSICSTDFGPALDTLIEKIANKLTGNCLPRQLNPDSQGRVPCDVYELLPKGEDECTSDRGHVGDPVTRSFQVGINIERRKACKMQQVSVGANGTPAAGEAGWYYDDRSQGVMSTCPEGQRQRIVFSFGDLPEGASATFECFQSSLKADATARGFDAVNTSCRDNANVCRMRSNTDYTLACVDGTCQAQCQANPDCPPGWVCASKDGGTSDGGVGIGIGRGGPQLYCQLPTCPASETMVDLSADDDES